MKRFLPLIFLGIAIVWSWPALEGSGRDLPVLDNVTRFLGRFFPPNFDDRAEIFAGLVETARIGIMATFAAAIVSLGIGFCGGPWMPKASRGAVALLLAFVRAVPSLVWAMIAVAVVGPHSLAGVIALSIYSLGYLGKFLIDDFHAMDLGLLKTYRRWGLSPLAAFRYGFWPQLKRRYSAHCRWMLEYNIRSAAVIGYVGAGGLGLLLHSYQEYGQWDRFCAVLVLILAIVLGFELYGRWRRFGVEISR